MANIAWTGATDDDFDVGGNWVGGVKPGLADRTVFDHRALRNIATNIDRTADGTFTGGLNVAEGMTYNIGASGNPLIMKMNATVRMHGSGDEFWFDGNTQAVPEFIAAPAKHKANACQIDGTLTDLTCLRGQIQLNAGATVASRCRVMRDPNLGGEPLVIVPSGVTVTGSVLTMLAGEIQTEPAWPTVVMRDGLLKHDDGTFTVVYLDGGELRLKEGTITTLYQGGGLLDGKTYSAWTITTAYIEAGVADFQNGIGTEPGTLKIYPMATVRRASGVS